MKKMHILFFLFFIIILGCIFLFSGFTKSNLDSWVGEYIYTEIIPIDNDTPSSPMIPCIEYKISIFKKNNEIYAEIYNKGYQTNTHLSAIITGNNKRIDLLFELYLEDNLFNYYQRGDLLISLFLNNNEIYTTWKKMISEKAFFNKQLTGIYFIKIN